MVSGLWHGANWTFVIWGAVHGLAQVAEDALSGNSLSKQEKRNGRKHYAAVIPVFLFVSFAWIFFRAATLNDAWYIITNAFTGISSPLTYLAEGIAVFELGKRGLLFCAIVLFLLGSYDFASEKKDVIAWVGSQKLVIRWMIYMLLVWGIIFFTPTTSGKEFIYFQF